MTHAYRDRDWDEVSRQSEPRSSYSIRRYVIPSERDSYRRDEPAMNERELAIRRPLDRDDRDFEVRRYERDYDRESNSPIGISSRARSAELPARQDQFYAHNIFIQQEPKPIIIKEVYRPSSYAPSRGEDSDYQLISRSEADDRWAVRSSRDPRDDDYYYSRSTRDYDNGRHYRDEYEERYYRPDSPRSSGSRRTRSHRGRDYSSDDDMVHVGRSREYRDESPHHHARNLAGGALVGVGAAELVRRRSNKEGEKDTTMSRIGKDVGAGALGAVAAEVFQRARSHRRSKSRSRAESLDRGRDRGERRHRHRRHRSRSSSDSHIKTLAGLGLGAAAIAGAVALARKKSEKDGQKDSNSHKSHDRRSRSRHRRGSHSSGSDDARNPSHRNKRMAEAGLAGAAVAGLIERARSKSRSRKGERSKSRVRQGIPIAAAGLGSAAIAAMYEKNKAKKETEAEGKRDRRRKSRSRSRRRSSSYSNPSHSAPQLIEYGDDPVYGSIPANSDYYGRPPSGHGYYPEAIEAPPRRSSRHRGGSRSRSRSRHYRSDRSGSSSDDRDGHRKSHGHKKDRSRSRTREFATAGLAAAGAGLAAREYTQRQHRKEEERRKYGHDGGYQDSYEEGYDPAPYAPSPPPNGANYYPQGNRFPPPPGPPPVAPNIPPGSPYNPADYPPPPGAPPPPQAQPNYTYPSPPGADPYAPRPVRGDENVSAVPNPTLSSGQRHLSSEGITAPSPPPHPNTWPTPTPDQSTASPNTSPPRMLLPEASRPRSSSQPLPSQAKTVHFDLRAQYDDDSASSQHGEQGYETDDSDSTIDNIERTHHRHQHYSHHHHHHQHGHLPPPPIPHQPQYQPQYHQPQKPPSPEAASDTTIDLPDHFDSHGHRQLVHGYAGNGISIPHNNNSSNNHSGADWLASQDSLFADALPQFLPSGGY